MMSQLLQAGLNVTAIGMGVVFVLLTALVFIIRGMSALCHAIESRMPAAPQPAPRAATPAPTATSSQTQEIVSVISAAVAAHRKTR
jgi:oxaloacetate decarboxylase gamma subunit